MHEVTCVISGTLHFTKHSNNFPGVFCPSRKYCVFSARRVSQKERKEKEDRRKEKVHKSVEPGMDWCHNSTHTTLESQRGRTSLSHVNGVTAASPKWSNLVVLGLERIKSRVRSLLRYDSDPLHNTFTWLQGGLAELNTAGLHPSLQREKTQ